MLAAARVGHRCYIAAMRLSAAAPPSLSPAAKPRALLLAAAAAAQQRSSSSGGGGGGSSGGPRGPHPDQLPPLDPQGTPFQLAVWALLREIPRGGATSYGELAARLGNPTASRAVGAAVGRNPIGILVPCHRVIGKDGALTGYAGGLALKTKLLQAEGLLTGELC